MSRPRDRSVRGGLALLASAAILAAVAGAGAAPPSSPGPEPAVAVPPAVHPLAVLHQHENPLEAGAHFAAARAAADGSLPAGNYVRARRRADALLRAARARARLGQVAPGAYRRDWTSLGPGNVGGRTRAILIDPRDTTVLYAGGVAGGVWKSTDAGASWKPITDRFGNVAVDAMAMDPRNPDVIYVGTGEKLASGYNYESLGIGILRTTDAGRTWSLLPSTAGFGSVADLAISHHDSRVLYAGTGAGVMRSRDGGDTWELVLQGSPGGGCSDLAIRSDREPDTVFASCSLYAPAGIFRSVDGGTTWENVVSEVLGRQTGFAAIAIAPSNQDVIYASVSEPFEAQTHGSLALLRSSSGGGPGTWEVMNEGGWAPGKPSWLNWCNERSGQGFYGNSIGVDPTNPDRIWTAGVDAYRSDDGGRTLTITGYWWLLPNRGVAQSLHADHHAVVFDPNYDGAENQTIYYATDGGIYRTRNALAPLTNPSCVPTGDVESLNDVAYEILNHGYAVTQFWGGAVADDGSVVMGGTQDNGTFALDAGGGPDDWRLVLSGDGFECAVSPRGDAFYGEYATATGGFGLSKFTRLELGQDRPIAATIADSGLFSTPFILDPNDPNRIWLGGKKLWRSDDAGGLFVQASESLTAKRGISAIAVARGNADLAYAATDEGRVWASTNATAKPPAWTDASAGLPAGFIGGLAIDPSDPRTAYVVYSTFGVPHVWKTADGGASWSDVSGVLPDVPANAVAINPLNPAMVYVGTDAGIYESPNGGRTWLPANGRLTSTIVMELTFRPGTSELFAWTHGRGVFKVDVGTGA